MQHAYHRLFGHWMERRWRDLNETKLEGRLEKPVFAISDGRTRLGTWDLSTRTLSLSADLLLTASELEIEEVLAHEMAHQFADEILEANTLPGETPHGAAFRYACERLEIRHSASMKTKGKASPMLDKIRKLLALAESPNVHEAEVAMSRAKDLMERYETDLGIHDHDFCYDWLRKPRKQKSAAQKMIGGLLTRFFGVSVIWVPSKMIFPPHDVWLFEVMGTRANLEVASYVYDYLVRELEVLWKEQRRANPQIKGRSLKRDFQLGVLRGLKERLRADETPVDPEDSHGALVLLKREKLQGFYEDRHPNVRKTRTLHYRRTEAYEAGFREGKNLDIRKGLQERKAGPKRLGS